MGADTQSYDNLNVPDEEQWKRTTSISVQNEESLSDLKLIGPDIRASHHGSLDSLDDESISNSKTFAIDIEETETPMNKIKKIDVEINPFEVENPFAIMTNDKDAHIAPSDPDNPFGDASEHEEEES